MQVRNRMGGRKNSRLREQRRHTRANNVLLLHFTVRNKLEAISVGGPLPGIKAIFINFFSDQIPVFRSFFL